MTDDFQPNELLKNTKSSHTVPVVRASQPPKWHSRSRYAYRFGRTSQHNPLSRSWHSQSGNEYRDRPTRSRGSSTSQISNARSDAMNHHGSQNRVVQGDNSAGHAHLSSTFSSPFRANQQRGRYSGDNIASTQSTSTPSWTGRVQYQQFHNYEVVDDRIHGKRVGPPAHKFDEMKFDLPAGCRKGAFRRSHYKASFLAEACDHLKRVGRVEIIQHRFTEDQLIITYRNIGRFDRESYPGTNSRSSLDRTSQNPFHLTMNPESKPSETIVSHDIPKQMVYPSTSSHQKGSYAQAGLNASSGSNVKLEDLAQLESLLIPRTEDASVSRLAPKAHITEHHTGLGSGEEALFSVLRQISSRPRPFRSGWVTLSYGPPDFYSGATPIPNNSAPLSPEVIEIDITPPESPTLEDTVSRNYEIASPEEERSRNVPREVEHQVEDTHSRPSRSRELLLERDDLTSIQLPRASGDKMRRIISSGSRRLAYSVTMHGFIYKVDLKSRRYLRELQWHSHSDKDFVEDVCMFLPPFDDIVVVAQSYEDNSLSLLHLEDNTEHKVTPIIRTSSDRERLRRGVSAVTSLPLSSSSLSFISAGYDHVVHLWSFNPNAIFEEPPISGVLDVHHSSLVQSLLSVANRLISGGADNSIRVWDLQAAHMVSTIRTSNAVYQLHRTDNPDITLAEVAHRDMQFEMHDCRLPPDGRTPVRFGYPSAQGVHGRYARGDVDPYTFTAFASAGRDGVARLWDLRNVAHCKQEIICFPGQKIVHSTFTEDGLVVASDDNRLLFLEYEDMPIHV